MTTKETNNPTPKCGGTQKIKKEVDSLGLATEEKKTIWVMCPGCEDCKDVVRVKCL